MGRAVPAIIVAAALLAPAAAAKDGAQAHLLVQLPAHAAPGSSITVRWTVDAPNQHGKRVPFGAKGMFVKLVGADGASTTATAKQYQGPYSVRIRVPAGGIHAIRIGLHGFAMEANGTTRPAPMLFPVSA